MFSHVLKMFAGIRRRLKKRSCVIVHFSFPLLIPRLPPPRLGCGDVPRGPRWERAPWGWGLCRAEGREGESSALLTRNGQNSSAPLHAFYTEKAVSRGAKGPWEPTLSLGSLAVCQPVNLQKTAPVLSPRKIPH